MEKLLVAVADNKRLRHNPNFVVCPSLFQLLRIYNDARKKKKKQGFMAAELYWPYP
jgi:hypothetical protein